MNYFKYFKYIQVMIVPTQCVLVGNGFYLTMNALIYSCLQITTIVHSQVDHHCLVTLVVLSEASLLGCRLPCYRLLLACRLSVYHLVVN
jgi:hypothetical protein